MCFSTPDAPRVAPPEPPENEKILDLNKDTAASKRRTKARGTRGLQIPLSADAGSSQSSGLKIPV